MNDLKGKVAIVTGGSRDIGRAISVKLASEGVKVCINYNHSEAKALETLDMVKAVGGEAVLFKADVTKEADVVVVAAGRPNTLRGDMLKPGAVVIDVGVNRIPDATRPKGFRLVGDADFDSCSAVASAITPVPGGVGPMTITMLLWNTLESAKRTK